MTARTQDGFLKHLRDYFTVYLPRLKDASPNTIESTRRAWNALLAYTATEHRVRVEQITFTMLDKTTVTGFLQRMRVERSWTASTYNQRLSRIRAFFTYAATAEPTLAVFLADLKAIPRLRQPANPPVKHMSETAVKALLAQPDPSTRLGLRDQFFMILMYDLAARDGELLAMKLADLNPDRREADLLGKGAKPRRLPVTAETISHHQRYTEVFHPNQDPDAPLFYTIHRGQKTHMSDDNAARIISHHARAAHSVCPEVPPKTHPHMVRHSRAMHLYQAGMPLAMLAEWLGHQDPETTLIYAHADTDMKRRALEKATEKLGPEPPLPAIWHNEEDIIMKLCGLT